MGHGENPNRGHLRQNGYAKKIIASSIQECLEFLVMLSEALFLAKAPIEETVLGHRVQNALSRSGRSLEMAGAEMLNRRAQEHAFPASKRTGTFLKCGERLLQIVDRTPSPEQMIEIRIIAR
jgi:hypothetical protein